MLVPHPVIQAGFWDIPTKSGNLGNNQEILGVSQTFWDGWQLCLCPR